MAYFRIKSRQQDNVRPEPFFPFVAENFKKKVQKISKIQIFGKTLCNVSVSISQVFKIPKTNMKAYCE